MGFLKVWDVLLLIGAYVAPSMGAALPFSNSSISLSSATISSSSMPSEESILLNATGTNLVAAASSTPPISFLRSPQCTASWQSVLQSVHSMTTEAEVRTLVVSGTSVQFFDILDPGVGITAGITLSGPTTTTVTDSPETWALDSYGACCGVCSIYFENVQLKYWPEAGSNTACLSDIDPSYYTDTGLQAWQASMDTRVASNTGNVIVPYVPFPTLTARAALPTGNVSGQGYAVGPDGFTYVSPYAYVVFDTIEASDNCGAIGGKYTSITWSFAPGELSTIEGRLGPVQSFNFADLPCPPSSVSAADWYNYKPGQPYQPQIAPVPQLFSLDPAFAGCGIDIYEGWDPPYALTPAAVLASTTEQATQTVIGFDPAPPSPITPAPIQTTSSKSGDVFEPVSASNMDPGPSAQVSSRSTMIPILSRSTAVPDPPQTYAVVDPPNTPALHDTASSSLNTQIQITRTSVTPEKPPAQISRTSPVTLPPKSAITPLPSLTPLPPVSTADSPAAYIFASHTITQGASPVIVGTNTIIYSAGSIYVNTDPAPAFTPNSVLGSAHLPQSAPIVVIGSLTFTAAFAPTPTSTQRRPFTFQTGQTASIFVAGTETFTILPSAAGYVIAGQTVSINGPPVTVSGTIISAAPSVILIGTQSYALPAPAPLATPMSTPSTADVSLVMTIHSQLVTLAVVASGGGYVLGGSTLLPGQVATVDGVAVSVLPGGGDVVVGSNTVAIGMMPVVTASTQGLGAIIISAFGPGGAAATTTASGGIGTSTIRPFEGCAGRIGSWSWSGLWWMGTWVWVGFGWIM